MIKKKYSNYGLAINNPIVTVASHIIFQGMRYMTPGERIFKLTTTAALSTVIYLSGAGLVVAIALAHGFNFLISGQIPVLLRYVLPDIGMTRAKVEYALARIERIAIHFDALDVLVFGSFSRFSMKSTSDLDIRLYHRSDFLSSLKAYICAFALRVWANAKFIPIDIYCFSNPDFLKRMRQDEVPALLLNSKEMLLRYPLTVSTEEMLEKNTGLQ